MVFTWLRYLLYPLFFPASNKLSKMFCTAFRCIAFVLSKVNMLTKITKWTCQMPLYAIIPFSGDNLTMTLMHEEVTKQIKVIRFADLLRRLDPLQDLLSFGRNDRTIVVVRTDTTSGLG
jgi:hypothetical protein